MDKNTKITLSTLPSIILEKIPFSIKTKKDVYVLSELPLEIQYFIEKYFETALPTITYDDALDFKFDISKYSDLGIFNSTSDLLKEYLKNYLLTRLKSYPFDPEFGCALKDQLMMSDTSLRQTYIANELYMITSVLSRDLSIDVKVVKFKISRQVGTANTEYVCQIELKVDGNLMDLSVTTSND